MSECNAAALVLGVFVCQDKVDAPVLIGGFPPIVAVHVVALVVLGYVFGLVIVTEIGCEGVDC